MVTFYLEKEEEETLIKSLMENYPEYSCCLVCEKYDYKNCIYTFFDEDENKTHEIGLLHLREGLRKLIKDVINKKIFFSTGQSLDHFIDPGLWDAGDVDLLVQYTIFGGVIYG